MCGPKGIQERQPRPVTSQGTIDPFPATQPFGLLLPLHQSVPPGPRQADRSTLLCTMPPPAPLAAQWSGAGRGPGALLRGVGLRSMDPRGGCGALLLGGLGSGEATEGAKVAAHSFRGGVGPVRGKGLPNSQERPHRVSQHVDFAPQEGIRMLEEPL